MSRRGSGRQTIIASITVRVTSRSHGTSVSGSSSLGSRPSRTARVISAAFVRASVSALRTSLAGTWAMIVAGTPCPKQRAKASLVSAGSPWKYMRTPFGSGRRLVSLTPAKRRRISSPSPPTTVRHFCTGSHSITGLRPFCTAAQTRSGCLIRASLAIGGWHS
jgi:hypothetical protein